MSSNNEISRSPFEVILDSQPTQDTVHVSDPMIGDPNQDKTTQNDLPQENPDTCAIRCQKIILDEFEGKNHTEQSLVDEATEHHIYSPGSGTSMEDVGKLLGYHHIPYHQEINGSAYHLANELAQGHKVIIGVDSSELWDNPVLHTIKSWLGMTHADHAVLVSGIDTSDPDHTRVVITDPGTGHAASYPIEQFTEAWRASHFYMVATDNPAPSTAPGMQNFNYAENHIQDLQNLHSEQLQGWLQSPPDPNHWGDLQHYPDPLHWSVSFGNNPINVLEHAPSHPSVTPSTGLPVHDPSTTIQAPGDPATHSAADGHDSALSASSNGFAQDLSAPGGGGFAQDFHAQAGGDDPGHSFHN